METDNNNGFYIEESRLPTHLKLPLLNAGLELVHFPQNFTHRPHPTYLQITHCDINSSL